MGKEIVKVEVEENKGLIALSSQDVVRQVALIQEIMQAVMRKDEHYGVIPGTPKPTLYKSGAEKLCLTFRLAPNYEIIDKIERDDFITYTVKCNLTQISTQQFIASGIGSCNSKEIKYRHRKGTPWDLANVFVKMAEKRAFVAAVLNATAASDIFTQDLEDLPLNEIATGNIIEGAVVKKDTANIEADTKNKFELFLDAMKKMKGSIGTMYYVILEKHGFKHANEIKSRAEQEKIYKEMVALQTQLRENQLVTDSQINDILAFIAKQGALAEEELQHHLKSFYGYESLKEIEAVNLYEIYEFLKGKEILSPKKNLISEASKLYAKLIDEKRVTIEEVSSWMAKNDMVSFEKATEEQLTKFIKEFTIKDSHF